jgi:predicted transcriptional regulator
MNDEPTRLTEQDWLDALDRAKADIAAGRIVPAEQALVHIDRVLEDMRGQAGSSAAVHRR